MEGHSNSRPLTGHTLVRQLGQILDAHTVRADVLKYLLDCCVGNDLRGHGHRHSWVKGLQHRRMEDNISIILLEPLVA